MKNKRWILLGILLPLFCLGCDKEGDTIIAESLPEQHLACKIFMPEDGETISLKDKLIIRGEGTADYGKIISAELKVGGVTISDISSVPFYYEYAFTSSSRPGELKIELSVVGDCEATASTSITVQTVNTK
jgi:hypothetical protein